MTINEQQVYQTFSQLGIGGYGNSYGSGYGGGGYGSGYSQGYGGQQVPQQYRDIMPEEPKALDSFGFWDHLWWGATEPITGTLAKLSPEKFGSLDRPEPTSTAGMVGRMLGGAIGWGAIFGSLALPAIGAPLTALTGAAAIKIGAMGVGSALAKGVAYGAITGGVAMGHQAWMDDKPIGPEALKGLAFGAAMGAAGYGVGKALSKLRITQPSTFETIQKKFFEEHGLLSGNDPTDDMIYTTMKASRATSRIKSGHVIRELPRPELNISDDAANLLTKKQREFLTQVKNSKNFGEFFDSTHNLEKAVTKSFNTFKKKYDANSLTELLSKNPSNKTVQAYQTRFEILDTLKNTTSEHFRSILHGEVLLPSLRQIGDVVGEKFTWKGIQQDIDISGTKAMAYKYHPKFDKLFAKYQTKDGVNYAALEMSDWAKKSPELVDEFNLIAKGLKESGQPIKFYNHDSYSFPLPDDIKFPEIESWVASQTKLPKAPGFTPASISDHMAGKTEVTWFTKNLFPIRYGIGTVPANQLRTEVTRHTDFVGKRANEPLKRWADYLGVKLGTKAARENGTIIGKAGLELDFAPNYNDKFSRAGKIINAIVRGGDDVDDATVGLLARELQLSKKDVVKSIGEYTRRLGTDGFGKKGNLLFEEFLDRIGSSGDDYVALWLKQQALYKNGAKPTDIMARAMGFQNTKQLSVAYQMKNELDDFFIEAGIDPIMYQVGYMPKFKSGDNFNAARLLKSFDDIGLPEKPTRTVMWMNQLHRDSAELYTYETDAFKAFSRYVVGYSKHKHYAPAFENINKYMKASGASKSRVELYTKVQEHLKGVPSKAEIEMDRMIHQFGDALNWKGWNDSWGPRPTREMASLLAELQVHGGLGFNPFTAAKNLTQKILAASSITDDGNPLRGLYWIAKAQAAKRTSFGKSRLAFNHVAKNRISHEGLNSLDDAQSAIYKKMGLPDPMIGAADKVKELSMKMFRWSDMDNVDDTFLAKMMYMEKQGASLTTAVNAAQQTTMATQFMYGFDSPLLYKSTGPLGPVGRAVGVFTSWPLNWAHLMVTQGTQGEGRRALASVVSMAVASEILNLTKFSFNSIHPAETAKGILPIAMMEGEQGMPMLLRSAATGLSAFRALAQGDYYTVDRALDNFKQRMWLLVPSGTMAKRVLNVIDLARNEWKKVDDKERLEYNVAPGEAYRSLIGPTIEQNQRYEDWIRVTEIDYAYKDMRVRTLDAFLEGDYDKFQHLQEQLVINFGKWIEPKDVLQELELRGLTARERQMQSIPLSIKEPFLERIDAQRVDRLGYVFNQ